MDGMHLVLLRNILLLSEASRRNLHHAGIVSPKVVIPVDLPLACTCATTPHQFCEECTVSVAYEYSTVCTALAPVCTTHCEGQ